MLLSNACLMLSVEFMQTIIYEMSLTNGGNTVRPKSTAEENEQHNANETGTDEQDAKRARYD